MPVLVSQASLTLYLEEGGSVLALVGEDNMDTPMLAGMEPLPLTRDMVIHTPARATLHSTGTHIDIHELLTNKTEPKE